MTALESLIDNQHATVKSLLVREDEPSNFHNYDDFQLLLLRRLRLLNGELLLWSEAFLFKDKAIYQYNRESSQFEPFKSQKAFCKTLRDYYENNNNIIFGYSSEIETLEDSLFDRDLKPHFMDMWFRIKKDLAKFENFYYRNLVVFREFQVFYNDENKQSARYINEIYETIGFQNSSIETLKTRLDSLHHYYDSIKQERLNKSLFTLTVISAVFLPMNLIVGFFGMNTEGLFFTGNPKGTMTVVTILLGVTIFTLVGFKVVRMMDKYLLRFILGRFNFYKNLTHRFEKIDKHLRGS